MKQGFLLLTGIFLIINLSGQTIKTIGVSGADYPTLKDGFDAINAGTITGEIVFRITGNTTESATASLNASGTGSASYSTLLIYPIVSGLTISGNLNLPMIKLNGADNVTLDGRVNQSGGNDLVITNSNTGTSAVTIQLLSSACGNTFQYCRIRGATKNNIGGVIHFGVGTTTGNISNKIDHCDISKDAAGYPTYLIYSVGTTSKENVATITNNNLFDYYNTSSVSYALLISSYNTGWIISGNSIYQTTTLAGTAVTLGGIFISGGTGFQIYDNYIGGSAPGAGGSPWTTTNAGAIRFIGISAAMGYGALSYIYSNIIRNFYWGTFSASSTIPGVWAGIYLQGGLINVGVDGGNIIGSETGTGNITISTGNFSYMAGSYGIVSSTSGLGNITIKNNRIGSITVANTGTTSNTAHRFYAIWAQYGAIIIENNLIGSLDTPNSIQTTNNQGIGTTSASQDLIGIHTSYSGSNSVTITGNTISNLHNAWLVNSSGYGLVRGILNSAGTGNLVISGNTVKNLSTATPNTASGANESLIGIQVTSSPSSLTISNNTISGLSNIKTGNYQVHLSGITVSGAVTSGKISANEISYGNCLTSATGGSVIKGIQVLNGSYTVDNNVISLNNNSNVNPVSIIGIRDAAVNSVSNSYYFNSVLIGGSQTSGSGVNSYAFQRTSNVNLTLKNNILMNSRSSSTGTGKNYAIGYLDNTGSVDPDYNDYYSNGENGVTGYDGSGDVSSLPILPGKDANSVSVNPLFNSDTDLHPAEDDLNNNGIAIPGVSTDRNGTTRGEPPDFGAYEFSLNAGVEAISPPLSVTTDSATLQGYVNPHNESATGSFEYGITSGYGSEIPWSISPQTGQGNRLVSAVIAGLHCNTLYHYRLKALTPAGYSYSGDKTFTTDASAASSFTGAVSASWNLSTNWTDGIPGTITDVTIPSGKFVLSDQPAECHDLTLLPGGQLTIQSGNMMNVHGNLKLASGITGSGSLIFTASGLNISGTTSVERYFSGAAESWHFLSSPVQTQEISGDFTPAGSYPDGSGYDFYLWNESNATWMNRKAATWSTANGGNNFIPCKGYLVAYQVINPVKTFTGQPNEGNFIIPLTNQGNTTYKGFNLVGNPYTSSIDWKTESGFDKSDLAANESGGHSIYIFNADAGNYGVYSDASAGDEGTNGTGRYIPAMQGFFVLAGNDISNPVLAINNDARVHHNGNWLKSGNSSSVNLTVKSQEPHGSDELIFEFGHAQSGGGAPKMFSFVGDAPSLWSEKNGTPYSISFYDNPENLRDIPICFKAGAGGMYTLIMNSGIASGGRIILKDHITGTETNLNQNPVYSFSASETDLTARFTLTVDRLGTEMVSNEKPFDILPDNGQLIAWMKPFCGSSGEILIYNVNGQIAGKQIIFPGQKAGISLEVPDGLYCLSLTAENSRITWKVVVAGGKVIALQKQDSANHF